MSQPLATSSPIKETGTKKKVPEEPNNKNKLCVQCKTLTNKNKSSNDKGFKCNVCSHWIHARCLPWDEEKIKRWIMVIYTDKEDTYRCSSCAVVSERLKLGIDLNAKNIEKNEGKILVLEDKVESQREELEKMNTEMSEVKARLAEIENGLKNKTSNGVEIDTDKISNDVLREMSDRKFRSKNLIIQGVTELGTNKDDTIKKDAEQIIEIFAHLNLDAPSQESLKKTERLGNHASGKIRPIKLILSDNNQVDQVLSKSAKLNEGRFKKIRIERDLTKGQRGAEGKIWEECQSKNRVGREELQIRKRAFKVVGRKGRKRIVELPLRDNEWITEEGKVSLERRDSVASEGSTRRDSIIDIASPARDHNKRPRSDGSTPGSTTKKSQKTE